MEYIYGVCLRHRDYDLGYILHVWVLPREKVQIPESQVCSSADSLVTRGSKASDKEYLAKSEIANRYAKT